MHMEIEGVAPGRRAMAFGPNGAYGIGWGGVDSRAVMAWAAVGIPLGWGVWKTLENAAKIFS
jgi:hypothetical protein